MEEPINLKKVVEAVVSSYEMRTESLNSVFDTAQLLLNNFQGFLLDTKEEREKTNSRLREVLSRNEHLRKKDFDLMMRNIFEAQDEKEKELRKSLADYLSEQKRTACDLKENFVKIKNMLARDEIKEVKELLNIINELIAKQERRKEEFVSKLNELQLEREAAVIKIESLLIKGEDLRIKDLKDLVAPIKFQRRKLTIENLERKEEVRNMLAGFREQRRELQETQELSGEEIDGNAGTLKMEKSETTRTGAKLIEDFDEASPWSWYVWVA